MQQRETLFKKRVLTRLKEIPRLWVVKIQQVALRGTPDLLMCYKGYFIAWELKTSNGKVSALQQYNIIAIQEADGTARVVTPENLEECLKELECLI